MVLTQGRKRVALVSITLLTMLATLGVVFFHVNSANAARPNSASTSSQIISSGTRTDAQPGSVSFLGTVNATQIPQGNFSAATTHNVPFRTWRKSTKLLAPTTRAGAPTGPASQNPTISTPGKETPLPAGTFFGQSENGWTPSDMGLAAGGGYIVQAVNDSIAVWNTNATLQTGWPKTPQSFFGIPSATFMYDPRVVFDSISGHFFVLFDEDGGVAGNYNAHYYIGVSATSNPTGAWHLYSFNTGESLTTTNAAFADFPILGIDALGLYFTGNRFYFTANSGGFANSFVGFAPLAQLEAGAAHPAFNEFDNLATSSGQAFAVAPTVSFGYPRAELMVDTDFDCATTTCNTYDVWALSNPTGTPRLTYVKITGPNWSLQPAANQPGTGGAGSIDAGDPRIGGQPVYRAGSIYFAIGTGYNNGTSTVAAVQWVKLGVGLDTGNAACGTVPNRCVDITSSFVQDSFLIGYTGSGDAFTPALNVTSDGDIVMTYTYSSLTSAPVTAIYGHRSTTDLGTLGTPAHTVPQSQSTAYYSQFRWGDYSAVALDSTTCSSAGCFRLWFSGMYVRSDGKWGTTISNELYNVLEP